MMLRLKKNIGRISVGNLGDIYPDTPQAVIKRLAKMRPEILINFEEIKNKKGDGKNNEKHGEENGNS